MKNFRIVTSSSVTEAIKIGSEQLGVPEDQLHYRILTTTQTIFGKKKVTLFLSKKEAKKPLTKKNTFLKKHGYKKLLFRAAYPVGRNYGKAWIKGGKVFSRNGKDHFPLLHPCEDVQILINGKVKTELTIITEADTVELRATSREIQPHYSMEASLDKMDVLLKVQPGFILSKKVCDSPPARYLHIRLQEEKTFLKLDSDEIYDELAEKFHAAPLHEKIHRACSAKTPHTYVIAKGTPAIPGKNAAFVPNKTDLFTSISEYEEKNRENILSYPAVEAGEIIGYITEPRKGSSGYDVFGNEIVPDEPQALDVEIGNGILFLQKQNVIAARKSGRISILSWGGNSMKFEVIPVYTLNRNVNKETGSVSFDGDVHIDGNVEAGMTVEATGNIHITGSVYEANIQAGGDVIIQGSVTESRVLCGSASQRDKALSSIGRRAYELLANMIAAIDQLTSNPAFLKSDLAKKGFQPLLKVLMSMKFGELPSLIHELRKGSADCQLKDWDNVVSLLELTFLQHSSTIHSSIQLKELAALLQKKIVGLEINQGREACIMIKSAHASELNSSGNIVVKDSVYLSTLHAKTAIKVKSAKESRVRAGEKITVNEAGSPKDKNTILLVEAQIGCIETEMIWPDLTIQVGEVLKKISMPKKKAVFRLLGNKLTTEGSIAS